MTFLEAKKIVEGKGYHVVKNPEGESFRQRVAREELEEAKRVAEKAGYRLIREDDNELDEGFGTSEGTPLSRLCADYLQDNYFTKLADEVGLEAAKAEFLEKAREVTGDKYYRTLSARIQTAKNATAVLFVLQGVMFGGSNMDLAAGTRQSAWHRNRR